MEASDNFASELSVTSVEYIKFREKALAEGRDPAKIRANAARSKKPSSYDESLASTDRSPYVRPDSDATDPDGEDEEGDETENASVSISIEADDSSNANNKNPEEDADAIATDSDEKEDEDGEDEKLAEAEKNSEEADVHTVSDEIRHQLATEEMSDEKRETLESVLPQKAKEPVRAIDVRMKFDTRSCVVPRNSNSWIGVMFRQNSSAIRGTSLNELDDLILLRERCEGTLIVEDYVAEKLESDPDLLESRRDEVKYYLLQSRVPKEFIQVGNL